MMSQHAALSSLFAEDPFFSQERLLWPLRKEGLTALQQGFFGKRSQLVDSLLSELREGPQLLELPQFPLVSSALSRCVQSMDLLYFGFLLQHLFVISLIAWFPDLKVSICGWLGLSLIF